MRIPKHWRHDLAKWNSLRLYWSQFSHSSPFFDCCFVSGGKWWTHVLSMVMNRGKNSALLMSNISKHSIAISLLRCLCSTRQPSCERLSHSNISNKCDMQHFFKCLPYLFAVCISFDGHPKPFRGFSSSFYLVDYCDAHFGSSYFLVWTLPSNIWLM